MTVGCKGMLAPERGTTWPFTTERELALHKHDINKTKLMYFFKREKYFQKKPLFRKRIVSNTPYLLPVSPGYLAQPEIHG